ncbi:DNA glycosylase/AP lyase ROS1-like isoform X2 [Aristolochia californica]|uniref:DNA glycosylase/AP lyase ROS1-like isoform X2 n=1 Tax=Aristolochia californica TaxID=171875 RepID=UPI0035DB9F39
MDSSDESRNLGRWRAVSPVNSRLAGFVAGSHMQAFENAVAGGSSLPRTQLFKPETAVEMQDGRNSSIGLWQASHPRIVTVPQQPAAGNLLLMHQNLNAANLWSHNTNPPLQMAAEGFPIPFHVMSRHRSPPNLNSNKTEVTNGGISLPLLAPVTPDRVGARRNIRNHSHELANSLPDRSAGVRHHEKFKVSLTVRSNEPIDQSIGEHFSHLEQLGPSTTIWHFSDPLKETQSLEKESQQSINHHPTPPKKSHNYEIENQPTLELLTPLKRTNYLHKEDHQHLDLNRTPPQKPPRKKKHRPKVVTEGKTKKTPQPVPPEQASKKRCVESKSDAAPSLNIGVEEVDSRKRAKSCRRALNFSLEADSGDGEGKPTDAMCSELTFNWDSQNQDQDTFENAGSNSFASLKSTLDGSHGLDITVDNSKAGIAFDFNHSSNQMLNEYISSSTNAEHQFASNNSTSIIRKDVNSSHSSPITMKAQRKEKIKVLARKKNVSSHAQEAEDCIRHPSYSATHIHGWNTLSSHSSPITMKAQRKEKIKVLARKKNVSSHVQVAEDCIRHPSYSAIHIHGWNTLSPTYINSKNGFAAGAPYATQTGHGTKFESNKGSGLHSTGLLDSHALSVSTDWRIIQDSSVPDLCKRTFSHVASSSSNQAGDPTYDITERFKHLSIYESSKGITVTNGEAHALVPYNRNGQIVPYGGLFDIIKKRQSARPKVDLDEETNRVWRLLMWKEGEEAEINAEKEKWWEAERQVFRGRVDSFIARMHRVQGDRRFSPWKGSVVDSVIGVFLTQNVSDHLSSSAFMALAARFPPQSRTKNRVKPEDCNLSINECQNKMSNKGMDLERSLVLHENEIAEEKETTSSIGSFGSNMMPSIRDYPRTKEIIICKNGKGLSYESLEDKLDTPRVFEDIVSLQSSVVCSSQSSADFDIQKKKQIRSNFESNAETANPEWEQTNHMLSGSSIPPFMKLLQMQGPSFAGGVGRPDVVHQTQPIEVQPRQELKATEVGQIEVSLDETGFNMPTASEFTDIMNASEKEKAKQVRAYDVPHCVVLSSCSEDASISSSCSPPGNQPPPVIGSESEKIIKALTEKNDSESLFNNGKSGQEVMETNFSTEKSSYKNGFSESAHDRLTSKRKRRGADRKKDFDWESLRRETCYRNPRKERPANLRDSLDYEAVRCADVSEISSTIKERGMNNVLAERIKDFLNRLVHEHGSIDLEWLRDVPPDKAKDYLLSVRGLGLKSVECVRLLTLHHLAFPVDTNVGRICVRLGWVPLQPLPESLQLHLLELYPVLESIQKYLWPRLCKLDQHTLYELHYQMITFGKVFCTKNKPNCNACPMKAECRHFASAFASARLALPGPEEKSLVMKDTPLATSVQDHEKAINLMPLAQLEMAPHLCAESGITTCDPIIEEPASPEPEPKPESVDISESAIEDVFWEEDQEEIPTIKLNIEEFSQNVQNYLQENNMRLQGGDLSKALVALTPEAASIPTPKLKNVSRLRTEHHVYELPDSHTLLKGLDPREPDDPCPYLLAIWTPGETAQSIEPPDVTCSSRASEVLCEKEMCFACNSLREADAQTVRGTLLIPCRTAMRGSFPLNGTYFQVNEVFADHDSSIKPIDVPRALIWSLPRRSVYFGTSIPTIFRGLTTEGIQHCFWRGFVCVRGFDQKTRAPRPLTARMHFPASKLVARKRGPIKPPEE